MAVYSPCSLFFCQAFHVSCQGHYIKSNPQKTISAVGEGASFLILSLKPEPVLKYPLSQMGL